MDAFKDLYEATYRSLYAFLLSMTRNADDAQDLLQDTYVQIHKNSYRYEKQGYPLAWMMKIAKNLFLMKCRKDELRNESNLEDVENTLGIDTINNTEKRLLLEKMFTIISDEERDIIIMHDVAGLKFREISKILEKPVGTVLARYNRSIKKMQKEFQAGE